MLDELGGVNSEPVFIAGFECRKVPDDLAKPCFRCRGASGVRFTGGLPGKPCQSRIGGLGDSRVTRQYAGSYAVLGTEI